MGNKSTPANASLMAKLLPIMPAVLVAFLVTGMAMPVLPLHVHQDLGFGTFVVGLVAGTVFLVSTLASLCASAVALRLLHALHSPATAFGLRGLLIGDGVHRLAQC